MIKSISTSILEIDFSQFKIFEDKVFQSSLTSFIETETQVKNSLSISFVNNLYIKSLLKLRENKINSYNNDIKKINSIVDCLDLNDKEKKVVNVIAFSVVAYYYYKIKDFDKSIFYTNEAIKNDAYFLKNHLFLYGHKIQQLHNIIRIFFRFKNIKEACLLNDEILCHLTNGASVTYNYGKWISNYNINNDIDMVPMIYQIFIESVYTVLAISKSEKEERELFLESFKKFSKLDFVDIEDINLLIEWIKIKKALLNNEKVNDFDIDRWIDKMLNSKFAVISKPLFYSIYVHLGLDSYLNNKVMFKKTYY